MECSPNQVCNVLHFIFTCYKARARPVGKKARARYHTPACSLGKLPVPHHWASEQGHLWSFVSPGTNCHWSLCTYWSPWLLLGLSPGILPRGLLSELTWSLKAALIHRLCGGISLLRSVIAPPAASQAPASRQSAASFLLTHNSTRCPLRIIREWSETDSYRPTTTLGRKAMALRYPAILN